MKNILKEIIAGVLIALEIIFVVSGLYGFCTDSDALAVAVFMVACGSVMIFSNVQYILTLHQQNAALKKQASAEIIHKQRNQHKQMELDQNMAEEIKETEISPEEYSHLLTDSKKQDDGKEQSL
jgi:hypothetical protein